MAEFKMVKIRKEDYDFINKIAEQEYKKLYGVIYECVLAYKKEKSIEEDK
jgi:phage tail protein X